MLCPSRPITTKNAKIQNAVLTSVPLNKAAPKSKDREPEHRDVAGGKIIDELSADWKKAHDDEAGWRRHQAGRRWREILHCLNENRDDVGRCEIARPKDEPKRRRSGKLPMFENLAIQDWRFRPQLRDHKSRCQCDAAAAQYHYSIREPAVTLAVGDCRQKANQRSGNQRIAGPVERQRFRIRVAGRHKDRAHQHSDTRNRQRNEEKFSPTRRIDRDTADNGTRIGAIMMPPP